MMKKELEKCFDLSGHQIVSVIGSGGKSSLIKHLSKSFPHEKILVSTTTKMLMPKEGEYDLLCLNPYKPGSESFEKIIDNTNDKIIIAGDESEKDSVKNSVEKLQLPKDKNFPKSFVKFDKVFLESDGSKGLPLKAWADDEPVVLPETTTTIAILPLTVIGELASENNIHRLPLWLKLCDLEKDALISEEILVKMITKENGLLQKVKGEVILFFNQVENKEQLESARKILDLLSENDKKKISKIIAGSVAKGKGEILSK